MLPFVFGTEVTGAVVPTDDVGTVVGTVVGVVVWVRLTSSEGLLSAEEGSVGPSCPLTAGFCQEKEGDSSLDTSTHATIQYYH